MNEHEQDPAWVRAMLWVVVGAATGATVWALSSEIRIAWVADAFARCVADASDDEICRELMR